jgi:NitT/TauT family transport system substrate-binding protein
MQSSNQAESSHSACASWAILPSGACGKQGGRIPIRLRTGDNAAYRDAQDKGQDQNQVRVPRRQSAGSGRREDGMSQLRLSALAVILCIAAPLTASAEDILVTQYKADPSGAPYGVGIEQGFFKKAGVDITGVISGEGGGASVRAVIASDLGYGETSPAGIIAAINEGQDIKIVDIGSRSLADNVIIVMPNSPIKTMMDLKGKKFGISNPKSLGEMTAVMAAEKVGLNPNDIQRVALGNLSGALTALENNAVEATSIPGILFMMRGGESKYRVIMGPKDLPDLPPAVGIATGDLIKKNPGKLRSILAGRREAVKFIYEHTADASKILQSIYAPLPPQGVDTMMQQLVEAKFYSEGRIEMRLLENTVRAMKYVGMLDKDPDLSKMIDTSFLPADLQK